MKALLLAEDLKDKSVDDRARSRASRSWARYFSEALSSPLQAATVLESQESVWEHNMIHKSFTKAFSLQQYKEIEKAKLENVANKLRAHPLFMVGSPISELTKLAQDKRFQMMVLGTHGYQGVRRLFLGSVAEEIVRHSEIPVCVIGPQAQKAGAAPPKTRRPKIMVATDLGRGSKNAEAFGAALAKKLDGELTLVHCAYQGQDPMLQMALNTPEGATAVAELFDELIKSSGGKLRRRKQTLEKAGIKAKTILDKKSVYPYRGLLRLIERENADFVVMGTHGRTLIGQAFFGSTARHSILRSSVPVIIVPS